ncbi:hypothetical protein PTSG_12306 [Salpingoeca rosetta]|uniref:PCI domain-containing protein n=1 Tax=Salpingoeca rosetta (strain ATCC 50818 / BSB-021) TaxID=946362 RepID=F2UA99_SALR5|nr:uncharacterized protein PTSG_12306 [Salpingoeca rosetta]EGD73674.1 hypothetical protein PTSG_12306 [Salpingoeca rosetta]|eukprot:XP_004993955.1 hypothetical protein PTSG_12306 [Salpingoeca rosetta]
MDAEELQQHLRALAAGVAATVDDEKLSADCDRLLDQNKPVEVLSRIVGLAGSLTTEEDMLDDMLLNAMLLQVTHQPAEVQDQLIPPFLTSLQTHTASGPNVAVVVSTVTSLFNLLPANSKHRYDVLYQLLSCGLEATQGTSELAQQVDANVDAWIKDWELTQPQQRALFKLFAAKLQEANNKALSKKYLTRYVKSFDGAAASSLHEASQEARDLIAQALNTSAADSLDLLGMDAVKHLKEEPGYKLLEVLTKGDVPGFNIVCQEHPSAFTDLGLDQEQVATRVQLMALAKFCAKKTQVTFAEVASGLSIQEDQVEQLVINALRHSVLEATIDDVNKVVNVTRVIYDSFEPEDWKSLHAQLMAWKTNIEQVRTTLDKVKLKVQEKRQPRRTYRK